MGSAYNHDGQSCAHAFFFNVDVQSFVSHFMGLGELVEVRIGYGAVQIEPTTHRAPEKKPWKGLKQLGRELIFSQVITVTR